MVMTDVMYDIETTGLAPDINAVIQIAGVKFNHDTGEIGGSFNRCLSIPEGRYWDESTRQFWQGKNADVYRSIVMRMEDPRQVMLEFHAFATCDGPLRFWAKPTSFDFPFIDSYCKKFGMMMPHHFRTARDLNTYIAMCAGGVDHVDMSHVELNGAAHDALNDVVYQLKCLFAAKARQFRPVDNQGVEYAEFTEVAA